ncbi:MAG: hypothetical protein WC455_22490 [Dehalococcoidia bacterium]|jgi:hypothetical protein
MDRINNRISLVGQFHGAPEVAVADTNGSIVTTVALSGLTAGALTIAAQPDYPRTIMGFLTDADASITGATVTLRGLDQNGNSISDVLTFTAAGAQTSVKAFAVLQSATWALVSGTVTTSSDTMALGFGTGIGMPAGLDAKYGDLLRAAFDDADDAGTYSKTYGTYIPAGTPNGAKHLDLFFMFSVPVNTY